MSDSDPDADASADRARMVGINHVALTVGDLDEAHEFYDSIFEVEVRGRTPSGLFLDMGDQFLALSEGDERDPDGHRHFGLVVDDPEVVDRRIDATDAERVPSGGLDFRDPWGNRIQVVGYRAVQFTKADHVAAGMGIDGLEKTEAAIAELDEKGLAPE
jgi:catechol 2,3-dioxygenase-like lactoylglutathione lyase family enzyme